MVFLFIVLRVEINFLFASLKPGIKKKHQKTL